MLFKIEHIKDFKILEKPNPILIDDAIISTSTQLTNTEEKKAPESQKKQVNQIEK